MKICWSRVSKNNTARDLAGNAINSLICVRAKEITLSLCQVCLRMPDVSHLDVGLSFAHRQLCASVRVQIRQTVGQQEVNKAQYFAVTLPCRKRRKSDSVHDSQL